MHALIAAVGGDKVGIKISPLHPYTEIVFTDPVGDYHYLLGELMKRSPMFPLLPHYPQDDEIARFGPLVRQTLMAGTAYTRDSAEAELARGIAQLIAFGSGFLANPDLPERFRQNAPLNAPDRATMFGGGEKGYIDYPAL